MIVKLVGASLLVSSSAYCAHRMISVERERINRLSAYIDIILHIKSQIDLYSLPIEKILRSIDRSVLDRIEAASHPSRFDDLISLDDQYVGEGTQKILREFSSSLGKGYREMQIKLCDKTISELENQKKELTDAFPSRKKTIIALCFAVCGMALIALI